MSRGSLSYNPLINVNMKASKAAYILIQQFESLHLQAYKCPGGILTIGYGHTSGVHEGMTITESEADELLAEDIEVCEKQINSLNLSLNQNQFDALVSFLFNVGFGNFSKSTLLLKVRINPCDNSIADEFAKWVYSKGKKLTGLQRRRTSEIKLYFS